MRTLRNLRTDWSMHLSASLIKCNWRCFRARVEVDTLLMALWQRSSLTVQCEWRAHMARWRMRKLLQEKQEKSEWSASCVLQRAVRCAKARARLLECAKQAQLQIVNDAAVCIARFMRGLMRRKKIRKLAIRRRALLSGELLAGYLENLPPLIPAYFPMGRDTSLSNFEATARRQPEFRAAHDARDWETCGKLLQSVVSNIMESDEEGIQSSTSAMAGSSVAYCIDRAAVCVSAGRLDAAQPLLRRAETLLSNVTGVEEGRLRAWFLSVSSALAAAAFNYSEALVFLKAALSLQLLHPEAQCMWHLQCSGLYLLKGAYSEAVAEAQTALRSAEAAISYSRRGGHYPRGVFSKGLFASGCSSDGGAKFCSCAALYNMALGLLAQRRFKLSVRIAKEGFGQVGTIVTCLANANALRGACEDLREAAEACVEAHGGVTEVDFNRTLFFLLHKHPEQAQKTKRSKREEKQPSVSEKSEQASMGLKTTKKSSVEPIRHVASCSDIPSAQKSKYSRATLFVDDSLRSVDVHGSGRRVRARAGGELPELESPIWGRWMPSGASGSTSTGMEPQPQFRQKLGPRTPRQHRDLRNVPVLLTSSGRRPGADRPNRRIDVPRLSSAIGGDSEVKRQARVTRRSDPKSARRVAAGSPARWLILPLKHSAGQRAAAEEMQPDDNVDSVDKITGEESREGAMMNSEQETRLAGKKALMIGQSLERKGPLAKIPHISSWVATPGAVATAMIDSADAECTMDAARPLASDQLW